jgi:prevent-host-death family protein
MTEIGAFDAKNQFSKLLARATRGEEFTITHRGRPVARLLPIHDAPNLDEARAAYGRMRERARTLSDGKPFVWSDWKQLRDEGRR